MHLSNSIKGFILVLLLTLCSDYSISQTYITINSGNWNDVTNVWSTDGGLTPCGCNPGAVSGGSDISIQHQITTTFALTINGGSVFTILPTGRVLGGDNISVSSASMDVFGPADFGAMTVSSSVVNIHTGVVVNLATLDIFAAGTMVLDGAQIISGQAQIAVGGQMTLMNSARYRCISSNFRNGGTIDIGTNCCIATNGNFRNLASGIINGDGVVNSGGNVQNNGVWSVNVDWCASGTGLGLPIPENCTTAGTVCGAIVLPIELVNFRADLTTAQTATINWETVSEKNNDYFILLTSADAINWNELGRIEGADNSTELIEYEFYDNEIATGITYYKLIQYDYDLNYSESDIISIENNSKQPLIYPNPGRQGENVKIHNISELAADIFVYNCHGLAVSQFKKQIGSRNFEFSSSNLEPGVYFIKIIQNGTILSEKLIVSN